MDLLYVEPEYWEEADILSRVGNDYVEVAMMTMVDKEDRWKRWVRGQGLGVCRVR